MPTFSKKENKTMALHQSSRGTKMYRALKKMKPVQLLFWLKEQRP
jgi:hypothetical protein